MASPLEPSSDWGPLDLAWDPVVAALRRGSDPLVVLFSGGVDSGLLAWELHRRPGVRLFTIGRPGGAQLRVAEAAASEIGLPWVGAAIGPSDLTRVRDRLPPALLSGRPTEVSVLTSLAIGFDAAPPGRLVCGQGADELFLGYAHFRGLPAETSLRRAADDLARLRDRDWPRTLAIAAALGREIVAPYLDPEFVRAVHGLPDGVRLQARLPKAALRDWARHRGLPASIAGRPKAALQYSSGVDRLLARRAQPAPGRG